MSAFQLKRASHRSFAVRCAGSAVIVCCLTALVRPALPATITDLGTLGGPSYAYGVNASGQVVGYSSWTTGDASHPRAFLYSGGSMHDLGTLGLGSFAYGINASGQAVGMSTGSAAYYNYYSTPCCWVGDIGAYFGWGGSAAYGINDSGQIVGDSYTYGNAGVHAFLITGIYATDLGTLGGDWSIAYGINASGQVVGASLTTGDGGPDAFLYSGDRMLDLGAGVAYGINVSGKVVGSSGGHAFLYSDGGMTDLGEGVAYGINVSGQVVGDSSSGAFLYSGSSMTDLNSLLPAGSGWQLLDARAINDSGQIVGWGYINGQQHAYLLDTVSPEPGSLALLGAGLVALGLRRWLRPGMPRPTATPPAWRCRNTAR